MSILYDVWLPLRYLLGHCIVYPSRRLVTPSVSSWPLYCLSFTTSRYPFGIFLAIILSILHDVWLPLRYLLGHCIVYPSRRLVTPSVSSWTLYCPSFTTSRYPFGIFLAIVLSILRDVWLPLRYLLGHYTAYPSRRLVTPSVSSWPLHCLSFRTSGYPFGIFMAIILSILHDVWLLLRYLLGHCIVYPSGRLVTPSVSSWPLYCLSFTTSGYPYPFGIFLAIILSILHDVWLPLRYLLGHCIVYPYVWLPLRYLLPSILRRLVTPSVSSWPLCVYPSRRLVTPSVSSWPLYCLSFTTSGYPFGIFLAIILSILHDVWLPLRYLLGHYIVYPSRRLVTPSVSSWPLYCLSFTTSGYPFGIFLAIILSILHDVVTPSVSSWPLYCLSSRRLVTPSVSSWPLHCLSFTTSGYPFGIVFIVLSILHDVWLPLRYLHGHYTVYPSRRLVTPSVSSWPLYCLSFTTSGYPFGIFLAIVLSILHDVWLPLRYLLGHYIVYPSRRLVLPLRYLLDVYLPLRYLLGHCIVYPSRRLVTPSVFFWPLYCLSFTTSGYPFDIFLTIILSILQDVWLPLRYLLDHYSVYPLRRLVTPSLSSWPLHCLSFTTSGYPFGIFFLAIILSILHDVSLPLRYLLGHFIVYPSRRLVTPSISS